MAQSGAINTTGHRTQMLVVTGLFLVGLVTLATFSVNPVGGFQEVAQITSKPECVAMVVATELPTTAVVMTPPVVSPQEPIVATAARAPAPVEVTPAVERAPHTDQMTAVGIA